MTTQDLVVSATDFVRHFAEYARAATHSPVLIAQRGRVILALVNVNRLRATGETDEAVSARLAAKVDIVLDTISTVVILVDTEARILRINAATRRYFGVGDENVRGEAMASLVQGPNRHIIESAVVRVLATGHADDFMLDSMLYPGRVLHTRVVPYPGGAGIFIEDVTASAVEAQTLAVHQALGLALESALVIQGRLNARGVIVSCSDALGDLADAPSARFVGARLSSLFAIASRSMVADCVESALAAGSSAAIDADFLAAHMTIGVRLSVSPILAREGEPGAVFVVVAATHDMASQREVRSAGMVASRF